MAFACLGIVSVCARCAYVRIAYVQSDGTHSGLHTGMYTEAQSFISTQDANPMSHRELSMSRSRWQVLVDFDGTVAPDDPTDRLLERFADPLWRVVETAWQSGQISSRECMQKQVELLRVTPEELDEEIRSIRVDPGVASFLKFCRRQGADVKIVSDGFDRVVRTTLQRARLSIPFFANRLEWQGGDRWRLGFPHGRNDCRVNGANCKCAHGDQLAGPRVVIGDGRSDFCMSTRADFVIAKGALADFCSSRGQPHATFVDFFDVTSHLVTWLPTADLAPATAPGMFARPQALPALER
jgi:2-hydroxy-3-keto-5-methylthiopentenyl-1-phosphate phosphatase